MTSGLVGVNGRTIAEYTIAFKEEHKRWPRYGELHRGLVEKDHPGKHKCAHETFTKYKKEAEELWGLEKGTDEKSGKKIYFVNDEGIKNLKLEKRLEKISASIKEMTYKEQEKYMAKLEIELAGFGKKEKMLKLLDKPLPYDLALRKALEFGFAQPDFCNDEDRLQDPQTMDLYEIRLQASIYMENVSYDPYLIEEIKEMGLNPEIEVKPVPEEEVFAAFEEGTYEVSEAGLKYLKQQSRFGWKRILIPPINGKVILGRYKELGAYLEKQNSAEQFEHELQFIKEHSNLSEEEWQKQHGTIQKLLRAGASISVILDYLYGDFLDYL